MKETIHGSVTRPPLRTRSTKSPQVSHGLPPLGVWAAAVGERPAAWGLAAGGGHSAHPNEGSLVSRRLAQLTLGGGKRTVVSLSFACPSTAFPRLAAAASLPPTPPPAPPTWRVDRACARPRRRASHGWCGRPAGWAAGRAGRLAGFRAGRRLGGRAAGRADGGAGEHSGRRVDWRAGAGGRGRVRPCAARRGDGRQRWRRPLPASGGGRPLRPTARARCGRGEGGGAVGATPPPSPAPFPGACTRPLPWRAGRATNRIARRGGAARRRSQRRERR